MLLSIAPPRRHAPGQATAATAAQKPVRSAIATTVRIS
jgi:hypothetical protein